MSHKQLSDAVMQDRIDRYIAGEPLKAIAADHGVSHVAILRSVKRHVPWEVGLRQRGPDPWHECARGHERTPENTYLWRGRRHCRVWRRRTSA